MTLIERTKAASQTWKSGFNEGQAAVCAGQYEADATMHARPFGEFTGRTAIQAFWQDLINQGFSDVEYLSPQLEQIDDESVLLTSGWKMNKASGVIHKELWVLQDDGSMKLKYDDFEVTGS